MQTLFEAANHIAQEIERTRQHLSNLEQALDGLKPLITIDAATTTLAYTVASQTEPVEDLSVINEAQSPKKKTKVKKEKKVVSKKSAAQVAPVSTPSDEPAKLPSTGAELWLKCLGRKKLSVAQIADAALKKLDLTDTARSTITTRAKAWAYSSVKTGLLVEAGMRDGAKLYQRATLSDGATGANAAAAEIVEANEAPDSVKAD